MKITITNQDLRKILFEKFGEADFHLELYETHQLLCKMWNRTESVMKTPALRKGRMASFDGFSAYLSLVDKRVDPARYRGSDISKDEKAVSDEIIAEGADNKRW